MQRCLQMGTGKGGIYCLDQPHGPGSLMVASVLGPDLLGRTSTWLCWPCYTLLYQHKSQEIEWGRGKRRGRKIMYGMFCMYLVKMFIRTSKVRIPIHRIHSHGIYIYIVAWLAEGR